MDRLFVGQRVRLRGAHTASGIDGLTGRIIARVTDRFGRALPLGTSYGWVVAPEGSTDPRCNYIACSVQLEALPPEGMQPVEWEDCAWQPDEVPELVRIPRRANSTQAQPRAVGRRFED